MKPWVWLACCGSVLGSGCVVIVDDILSKAGQEDGGGATDAQLRPDGSSANDGASDADVYDGRLSEMKDSPDASGMDAGHTQSDGGDAATHATKEEAGISAIDGGAVATRAGLTGCGGQTHACFLDETGELQCFGQNTYGQAEQPAGTFTSLSCGDYHTCAVGDDGRVVCWGSNADGQRTIPSALRDQAFVQVAAGTNHTCALGAGGQVSCWGDDSYGQSTPPPDERFSNIASGHSFSCGLRKSDSTAVCWGNSATNRTKSPPGVPFTALALGSNYGCGLQTDRFLRCWGYTDFVTSGSLRGDRLVTTDFEACVLDKEHLDCVGTVVGFDTDLAKDPWKSIFGGGQRLCLVPQEGNLIWVNGSGVRNEVGSVVLPPN